MEKVIWRYFLSLHQNATKISNAIEYLYVEMNVKQYQMYITMIIVCFWYRKM